MTYLDDYERVVLRNLVAADPESIAAYVKAVNELACLAFEMTGYLEAVAQSHGQTKPASAKKYAERAKAAALAVRGAL